MVHKQTKKEADRKLEEALEQTFPASDPVSTNQSDKEPVRPVDRKPACIDFDAVERMSQMVAERFHKDEKK